MAASSFADKPPDLSVSRLLKSWAAISALTSSGRAAASSSWLTIPSLFVSKVSNVLALSEFDDVLELVSELLLLDVAAAMPGALVIAAANSASVSEPELSVSKLLYKVADMDSLTSLGRIAANSDALTTPLLSASRVLNIWARDNANVLESELLADADSGGGGGGGALFVAVVYSD